MCAVHTAATAWSNRGASCFTDAGMRVIGVTTTLSDATMAGAGPDRILPRIGSISVEDLTSLRYEQPPQQQHQEDGAGPSGAGASASSSNAAKVHP
jgi:hypothetical protein